MLSQFSLGIFYSSPSAFDDLMMEFINSPQIEDLNQQYFTVYQGMRMKSRRISELNTTIAVYMRGTTVVSPTRPDTRLPQSRAGGQGPYLGRSSEAKDLKNPNKV